MARKISGKTFRSRGLPSSAQFQSLGALEAELRVSQAKLSGARAFSKQSKRPGGAQSPAESAAQLFASMMAGAPGLFYKPREDGSRHTFVMDSGKTCELRMLRAVKAVQEKHPKEDVLVKVQNLHGLGRHMVVLEACKKQKLEETDFVG
ncbi:MAG: hypothetical protein WC792_06280 [Candidatus Micrarchaeia archaeon]|jgi:hypothetical protein